MRAIVWFRRDLRKFDNLALYHAALKYKEIIPIYINDTECETIPLGGASKVWLYYSLKSLNENLNNNLNFFNGSSFKILCDYILSNKIEALYFNKIYEKNYIDLDKKIANKLKKQGVVVNSYNCNYISEPGEIVKEDNSPYKIFTPYLKKSIKNNQVRKCYNPETCNFIKLNDTSSLEDYNLLPKRVRWDNEIIKNWEISEQGAESALDNFIKKNITSYAENRNYPDLENTSNLSPYLHFGQISAVRIWHKVNQFSAIKDVNCEQFLTEIIWREFFCQILYFFPDLYHKNMKTKFNNFKWKTSAKHLEAWQLGKTGYPLVDAGMRELRQTGTMHNRIRMVCASFLVKNLLVDWQKGAEWFWDNLFDADLASNSANWQWVAGSGTDAAPYFRIFNPVTQAQRFDTEGEYVKKYIPELKNLPNKYLFEPWKAPCSILTAANLTIGVDYPKPIVDLKKSRDEALILYNKIS